MSDSVKIDIKEFNKQITEPLRAMARGIRAKMRKKTNPPIPAKLFNKYNKITINTTTANPASAEMKTIHTSINIEHLILGDISNGGPMYIRQKGGRARIGAFVIDTGRANLGSYGYHKVFTRSKSATRAIEALGFESVERPWRDFDGDNEVVDTLMRFRTKRLDLILQRIKITSGDIDQILAKIQSQQYAKSSRYYREDLKYEFI